MLCRMSTVVQFPERGAQSLTDTVSGEVKALMGRHGVSQTQLANWLGINQTAVSARLRGRTRWNLPEIERVAEGFAVHPAVLMGGYAEGGPHPTPDGGLPIMRKPTTGTGAVTVEYPGCRELVAA